MATKTSTKPTAKKADQGKVPAAKPGKARFTPEKEKGAGEPAPAPAVNPPPAVKEAISLIDAKPKSRRPAPSDLESKPFSALPPISRLKGPEAAPAPEPTPAPPIPPTPPIAPPDGASEGEEKPDEKIIHIKPPISVRELATQLGLKPFQVIHDLMEMNIFAAINQTIEPEIATKVCARHGFTFEKEKREKGAGVHKVEVKVQAPPPPRIEEEKREELGFRAPIVTFMGHVDHGKTTLMDAIRKTRVAQGESGGITQHIAAYNVPYKNQKITFLDTPGHAAFTAMRARGANVTDIVVLVIAADDGIMPQTLEAINHAKAAKVKIVVGLTKIDLPGANIDRVKGQLQEKGLVPEDWGGDIQCRPVSAVKGQGVEDLLEAIVLEAEMLELKVSEKVTPRATVIEAQIEQGRGPTATVIVRMGTLKVGDPFICGTFDGKVKLLIDDFGNSLKSATPATPCKVLGFSGLPNAGDELVVMESDRAAKTLSHERLEALRLQKLAVPQRATLENLFDSLAAGRKPVLNLVLKADVQGSVEAIVGSLKQIDSRKVDLEMVHSAVGPITESDVLLAAASNAVIIGFNVKTENSAASMSKREGIQIKLFSIIYELLDQVKEAMAGLLEPETRETVLGHAEIRKVFELSKGIVAGCYVNDGRILRTARARIIRGKTPIYDGPLNTLRRFQDDVKEVRSGLECGIKLGDFSEYEPGDVVQCYQLEKFAQKL
ncbi:MAG: translation initiation factor IF-2 [Verrucomicrobiota bacterium]|nr:translation initiation factor IF-2 [Verrucomicrobiota bacterium]